MCLHKLKATRREANNLTKAEKYEPNKYIFHVQSIIIDI